MASRRRMRGAMATLAFLVPVIAFVIWSSLGVSAFECEVCVTFAGRTNCRTVTGATEEEGIRSGIANACGLLAAGVTDSVRCNRTPPGVARCRPL